MVSLRNLEAADRERIRAWRNLPEVRANMFTDHEIGEDEHTRWFERMRSDPTSIYWIVRCDGEDVGVAHLYDINRRHGRCSWGFYLTGTGRRGPWVGSVVEYQVLEYVFGELALRKLCGEVLADNRAVVRMHTRFGFHREGLLRQHVVKRGVPQDVVVLGMLAEEWHAKRSGVERALRDRNLL